MVTCLEANLVVFDHLLSVSSLTANVSPRS